MSKFQAMKHVTNHTEGFVRANKTAHLKPKGFRNTAEELSPPHSSCLVGRPDPLPSLTEGLTFTAFFLAYEISSLRSTSLKDEGRL